MAFDNPLTKGGQVPFFLSIAKERGNIMNIVREGQGARSWTTRRDHKKRQLSNAEPLVKGRIIPTENIVEVLERLIVSGDRVALEGNNQKQASFLSAALAQLDADKVNHLHMIMSAIARPEHLDIFEKGIAEKLDFSFAGAQSLRIAQMIEDRLIKVGAIHTYLELYARLFIDLTPNIALVAADKADANGNLYTGPNTEDTPAIIEATAFRDGIVIVQVNEIVEELPRVDIPGSWVDFVVVADKPYQLEALFTRDPRSITDIQVLMAMMAIRGIYERHEVISLNHGVGFNTAAIELLLPTYGKSLGLKGKICKNWALNPHPTLIPAIESGWVESVHCFGGEVGMEKYIAARPDVFFTGRDGSMRSNRAFCQMAGQYAVDLFIGSTLQMDADGNSSTVTLGRLAGFGGAPNMGHDPRGRRHGTPAWLNMITGDNAIQRGNKLVVQMVETFQQGNKPVFVESLDAIDVAHTAKLHLAPVMIYGDDVTHVVTEEGVAYLYKAQSLEERREVLAAVAGVTALGMNIKQKQKNALRENGLVALPEDLGVRRTDAKRSLLAAKSIDELVQWSGGLYKPPAKFRNW
jgi:malonate decarboxylase alpha subunit